MASKTKKLLITSVRHQVSIVRVTKEASTHAFCPGCETEMEMLTLDSAARIAGISERQLIDQIVGNRVHSSESTNGHLLVCRESLLLEQRSSG